MIHNDNNNNDNSNNNNHNNNSNARDLRTNSLRSCLDFD